MKEDISKPLQILLRGVDITTINKVLEHYKNKYNLDISKGALFRKLLKEEFERIKKRE